MRFRFIFVGVLLAVGCAKHSSPVAQSAGSSGSAAPSRPAGGLALAHVTIVDVVNGTELRDRTVVIQGDRITATAPSDTVQPSPTVRVVEARGQYVIPGLWDMHVHFIEAASAKLFVANGVTGVRVMWGNPPLTLGGPVDGLGRSKRFHFEWRDAFDNKESIGPRMVIASQILDGPHPIWPTSVALSTPAEGRDAVDEAKKSGVDFIKVYSLLPREVYFAIADESRKQGLPFVGHVPLSVSVAEASDAGQKSIEHLTGLLLGCSKNEAILRERQAELAATRHSPAEWFAFLQSQTAEAIATYDPARALALFAKFVANGTWQCPTLTVLHSSATLGDPSHAADPRMQYVSALRKRLWEARSRTASLEGAAVLLATFDRERALVGAMDAAGVPLLAGTDEGNPYCFAGFGLHDELEWLVKAGLTPLAALRAATWNPARFFGLEDKTGSVADGKFADLVVLEADPLASITSTRKIASVVARGVLYGRGDLDKMLSDAKTP